MATTVFNKPEIGLYDRDQIATATNNANTSLATKEDEYLIYKYSSASYLFVRLTFPKSVESIVHVYLVGNSTARTFAGIVRCSSSGAITYVTEYKGSYITITTGSYTFTMERTSARCDTIVESLGLKSNLPTITNLSSV
jgi:hypothetical protein